MGSFEKKADLLIIVLLQVKFKQEHTYIAVYYNRNCMYYN